VENQYDREETKAKRKNLIVYVSGLQDPYFLMENNLHARWTNPDIGKLFSVKIMSLPLPLRIEEITDRVQIRQMARKKNEIQAHIRIEFYNVLKSIEHYRKTRDESVADVESPYRLVDMHPGAAESFLGRMGINYPNVFAEDLVQSVLSLNSGNTDLSEDPVLEAIGLGVKKGAQEYVNLKKLNGIGKKMHWRVHREYDMIMLRMVEELERKGLLGDVVELKGKMLEELAKEGYKRDANE